MNHTIENQERQCLWCNATVIGRTDKKFCNSTCKARYNAKPSLELVADITLTRPITASIFEQKASALNPYQQAKRLHSSYKRLLNEFLQGDAGYYCLPPLESLLAEIYQVMELYYQYDDIHKLDNQQRRRVSNLLLAQNYLQNMHEHLIKQHNEIVYHTNAPEYNSVRLNISKEHKNRLIAALM